MTLIGEGYKFNITEALQRPAGLVLDNAKPRGPADARRQLDWTWKKQHHEALQLLGTS